MPLKVLRWSLALVLGLGAAQLIGILAGAAVLHAAVGQVPPASFVIYAVAIWVVLHQPRAVAP